MTAPYLSRIRLKRDVASAGTLTSLLAANASPYAAHRLVWALFADSGDRRRDFLFRLDWEGGWPKIMTLSPRAPVDRHELFHVESREFAPPIEAGDILRFSLRANAVVSRRCPQSGKRKRHDIVMDAIQQAGGLRAAEAAEGLRGAPLRYRLAQREGLAWLHRHGQRAGFTPLDDTLAVDGYEQHRFAPANATGKGKPVELSGLDFEGRLRVDDPDSFVTALSEGFGRGKAFGFGLMLVRPG